MKLKINSGLFSELLSKIAPAIPTKSTLAILHNIYFSAKNGILTLKGTDLDFSVTLKHEMNIETDGEFLVSSSRLFSLIKTLPKHVDIDLLYEDYVLNIKCKEIKFTSKIVTFETTEFPRLQQIEGQYSEFELNIDDFNGMGLNSIPFISNEYLAKSSLTGPIISITNSRTHFTGIDGYYGCTSHIDIENETEGRYIISRKVFAYGNSNFSSGTVQVKVNEGLIEIKSGNLTVVSTNIEGPPPRFLPLFERDAFKTACVNLEDFKQAIKIVSNSSNKESSKAIFSFNELDVDIHVNSTDDGAESNISVSLESYVGDDFKISFSHKQLIVILNKIKGDVLTIEMGEVNMNQAYFTGSEQTNNEKFLLMPLRIL